MAEMGAMMLERDESGEGRAYTLRMLEDRVLRLETVASGLSDRHEQLRVETRQEISFLRDQMKNLETKMEEGHRLVNEKLDRLIGGRAVLTGLVTLLTSILGTGVVHFAFSLGTR
nr:hypothetical protein [uncultured Neokomagataea sp.]